MSYIEESLGPNEKVVYRARFNWLWKARGFIARETSEIQLHAVEEAALHQSIWGRLFNFGQITVHGTGGEDLKLPVLGDPITIRRLLEETLTRAGRGLGLYASSTKA